MTTLHLISIIALPIMLFCSAIAKAIMDTIHFNFSGSMFKNWGKWWNPEISWKNKWKNGDPSQGEAFLGSSTVFVSFCDGWHFFQHFFLLPLFLCMVAYSQCFPVIPWSYWYFTDFVVFYGFFTITFQVFYTIFNHK